MRGITERLAAVYIVVEEFSWCQFAHKIRHREVLFNIIHPLLWIIEYAQIRRRIVCNQFDFREAKHGQENDDWEEQFDD